MWNYKNGTDEPVCEAVRDIENKQMNTKEGRGNGMIERLGLKYTNYYV